MEAAFPLIVMTERVAGISGGADGVVAYYQTTLANQGTIAGEGNAFIAVKPGFADRIVVSPGPVFQGW